MGYIDENLIEGERVLYRARVHWFVYVPGYLVTGLSLCFMLMNPPDWLDPRSQVTTGAVGLFLVGLPMLARAWIWRISTELAVTSRRVMAKFGLISRRTVELRHGQVESLSVIQGILGRVFNFGTLRVHGTGGIITPIPTVDGPLEFRRRVLETVERWREGSGGDAGAGSRDAPAESGVSPG